MSRTEATAFMSGSGAEPPCVRFFRRADGTLITGDCSRGQRKLRQRVALLAASFLTLLSGGMSMVGGPKTACVLNPVMRATGVPGRIQGMIERLVNSGTTATATMGRSGAPVDVEYDHGFDPPALRSEAPNRAVDEDEAVRRLSEASGTPVDTSARPESESSALSERLPRETPVEKESGG